MSESIMNEIPDFTQSGEWLIKSMGYTIVEDVTNGDINWVSSAGEKVYLIIS